jgi:hypothetical protein
MRQGAVVQIAALAVEKPVNAEASFNVCEGALLNRKGAARNRAPCKRIGAIDERKGSKNSIGLPVHMMDTGSTATLDRIVHAGKIVEYQRCSVEVFERNCEILRLFRT